ncbi:DUF4199 domain-containing protein [Algoriphagus halophytocola]|uniref:DUF4199 domain-containing protein n=1 Tax=Algoriphagus halophytocola TaxID=2991499 RepID=A0ABY6MDM2_9BACT|nr:MULTISPECIES: DUF4199 domain-containing protein [unclassified Algoriphagus]UZD20980.1 DUF4199 domain-containing protein [Algoriphagus sp. TR-M5]WBL42146.1 DUF4199 domain-containing protein [Algoriphagus sp. TR-M9]
MKNIRIEIKWALIFVLMMLAWMMMEKSLGWHDEKISQHATLTNFVAIPAIAVYVFALLDKKKNFYQGTMSYKQGFVSGLIITLIVALLSPVSQYITTTFITPGYFPNVIDYAVESGQMSQADAEAYFNLKSYVIQSVIGALVMGLVTSAIVAIFVKSKRT